MKNNILLFLIISLLQGCCSVINGKFQKVNFSSNPAYAKVKVTYDNDLIKDIKIKNSIKNMKTECDTPCSLDLMRKINSYNIIYEKDGYEPGSATLYRKPSGWLWVDFIFPIPIFGFIIDLGEGSGYKLKPEQINIDLRKK